MTVPGNTPGPVTGVPIPSGVVVVIREATVRVFPLMTPENTV